MRAAPHVRFISDSLRHNAQRCARAPRPMPCPAYMWRTAPLRPLHGPAPLRIMRSAQFFRMVCAVRAVGASRLLCGSLALRAAHMVRPNTHGAASACPPASVSVSEQVVAPVPDATRLPYVCRVACITGVGGTVVAIGSHQGMSMGGVAPYAVVDGGVAPHSVVGGDRFSTGVERPPSYYIAYNFARAWVSFLCASRGFELCFGAALHSAVAVITYCGHSRFHWCVPIHRLIPAARSRRFVRFYIPQRT